MNRLLLSVFVPRSGPISNTIRVQSLQPYSSIFFRPYSSLIPTTCTISHSTPRISRRRYAAVPRPKISGVNHSEEWIAGSASTNKPRGKATTVDVIDLATKTSAQPFCDPPIKADDVEAKHTFKETEQEIVILPRDLNKDAPVSLRQLCDYYTRLSKKNLTSMAMITALFSTQINVLYCFILVLVATTAAYGCAVAPLPVNIPILIGVTVGTILTSASANTINQLMEIPYDAQMKRTRNRVLVLGQMSYRHAIGFASVTLISGVTILTLGCNPLTGALGLSNFLLYTCVYTPMKRKHIINTWLGSVVGAIPPVMGWTACTGSIDSGALLVAFLLYAWQFPHFNSLSWNIRREYERAGYQMMCVSHERLCLITSLRYSVMILLTCSVVAPAIDMTTWLFALDSLPVNLYLIYLSYQFYRQRDAQSSRKLFRYSLIHLPLLFTLMVLHRQMNSEHQPETPSTDPQIPVPM